MAYAIFNAPFHYTGRKVNKGWSIDPAPDPQNFPEEVIAAAVTAGAATRAKGPARPKGQHSKEQTHG